MRHGKKFNHLGRQKGHRKALLANMAVSLIEHKKISTTVAKAKALRQFVEPLITKAKTDDMNSRRTVFRYLQKKEAVQELFGEVASKVADRAGGYTRILKTGNRLGDNADTCIIELVDFNENLLTTAKPKKTRRRKAAPKKAVPVAETETKEESVDAVEEAKIVEDVVEEAPKAEDTQVEQVETSETEDSKAVTSENSEEETSEVDASDVDQEESEEANSEDEDKKDEEKSE
ncbi:MAG: 50S ribosomal protein L17 [Flavobacteriales bacterium]|nr:50S ribosomal protein L17 [Flavobacteriales bacterium]MBO72752.1 50S ribosomal protein L17 [Flavobacteriales bacterium]|tara:strand:- start:2002 stop:2697 length:696 start_codon:yes stop_codon:yes gene_type:complete